MSGIRWPAAFCGGAGAGGWRRAAADRAAAPDEPAPAFSGLRRVSALLRPVWHGAAIALLGDALRHLAGLTADVGDCGDLPEGRARHRPEREQPRARAAVGADQPAFGCHLQAEAQRVHTRRALGQKTGDDRGGIVLGIIADAAAIDDPPDLEVALRCAAPGPEHRPDRAIVACFGAQESGRHDPQPPPGARRRDPVGRGRRDAVAVHLPPGGAVAQETGPLPGAHVLPEQADPGPDAVDGIAPAAARGLGLTPAAAQPQQDHAERGAERQFFARGRQRRAGGMGARQEAAARDRDDRPGMPGALERQHLIDHRQPGADDQHRAARRGVRPGAPGPGDEARGVRPRHHMSGRQHGIGAGEILPVRERHLHPAGPLADRDAGSGDAQKPPRRRPGGQQRGEIAAIGGAADEAVAAIAVALRPGPQPAQEMVRVFGEGAHVMDPGVEQVIGIGGRIGDAAAEQVALLDHRDAQIGVVAQQVGGEKHAAGAAADHQHVAPARLAREGCNRHERVLEHGVTFLLSGPGRGRSRGGRASAVPRLWAARRLPRQYTIITTLLL
ncbi:hypothetical protein SDC9_26431 [bioreactor metagenome]|uniref:Uncharacterized protein n=1 Tax=bioreactor metagenome TaxID=1076179 RepID=A0A644UNG2_9ZZZZ